MSGVALLFWLFVGHAIADFWAQSDAVAKMKNRNRNPADFCPPGQKPQKMWFYALTSHALIHGGAVALVTGNVWLGCIETIAYWLIDFGKCDNRYGIHTDQALHFACKIAFFLYLTF